MMKKEVAILFSFNTIKTKKTADKLIELFGKQAIPLNAETIQAKELEKYENIILGVPTWNDGELPNYWDEFLPELEDMDLSHKKIAIYGGGDQVKYPENFVDGIGTLADMIIECGAELIGAISAEGYHFEASTAFRDNQFVGLPVDYENKGNEMDTIIEQWAALLKSEFY